jgi:hypothetical protein
MPFDDSRQMEESRRDMREIPMPEWETRGLTAKRSGRWAVFFKRENDTPIVNPESCISPEYITNPRTTGLATTCTVLNSRSSTLHSKVTTNTFADSYTLFRMRLQKESDDQRLYIRAESSLSNSMEARTRSPHCPSPQPFNPLIPPYSPFYIGRLKCGSRIQSQCRNWLPVQWNTARFGRKVHNFVVK